MAEWNISLVIYLDYLYINRFRFHFFHLVEILRRTLNECIYMKRLEQLPHADKSTPLLNRCKAYVYDSFFFFCLNWSRIYGIHLEQSYIYKIVCVYNNLMTYTKRVECFLTHIKCMKIKTFIINLILFSKVRHIFFIYIYIYVWCYPQWCNENHVNFSSYWWTI